MEIRCRKHYMFPKYFGWFSIGFYSSSEIQLNLIKCSLLCNRRGGRMRTRWPGRRECIFLLFCKPKIALLGLSLLDTMVIEWSTSDFFRSLFSVISHQINGLRVCIYYFVTHGRNKSFGCAANGHNQKSGIIIRRALAFNLRARLHTHTHTKKKCRNFMRMIWFACNSAWAPKRNK